MRDTNYFSVQSWMVTKLNLRGAERDVFAILYGFTQDDYTECKCSYNYMSTITGYTKHSIIDAIEKLYEKNLIVKIFSESTKDQRNSYRCNYSYIDELLDGVPTTPPTGVPTTPPTGVPTTPHNINNNKSNISAVSTCVSSKNRSFRNHQEKLTDDLQSGKDIDEHKKERKKISEEDKAEKLIDKTNYSDEVKILLKQFFNQSYHSTSDRRMRSAKDLDGRIHKLDKLVEAGEDPLKTLNYCIEQGYHSIWKVNDIKQNRSKEELSDVIIVNSQEGVIKQTQEVRRQLEEGESEIY